jgi:hypothetical protein
VSRFLWDLHLRTLGARDATVHARFPTLPRHLASKETSPGRDKVFVQVACAYVRITSWALRWTDASLGATVKRHPEWPIRPANLDLVARWPKTMRLERATAGAPKCAVEAMVGAGDNSWACEACGASMQWESIDDASGERWLGVCECGHLCAFSATEPAKPFADPLRAFLLGPISDIREPSPPWIRVFDVSRRFPWRADWRHYNGLCPACGQRVVFETGSGVAQRARVYGRLCLACGWTSAERLHAPGVSETPLAGANWAPPCPAVIRLRDGVFARPHPPSPTIDSGM